MTQSTDNLTFQITNFLSWGITWYLKVKTEYLPRTQFLKYHVYMDPSSNQSWLYYKHITASPFDLRSTAKTTGLLKPWSFTSIPSQVLLHTIASIWTAVILNSRLIGGDDGRRWKGSAFYILSSVASQYGGSSRFCTCVQILVLLSPCSRYPLPPRRNYDAPYLQTLTQGLGPKC